MLHPFMPFITEEVWQSLPMAERADSIMVAPFPVSVADLKDTGAEARMKILMDAVMGIRNVRGEMNINPSVELDVVVRPLSTLAQDFLQSHADYLIKLSRLHDVKISASADKPKMSAVAVTADAEIYILLSGVVDIEAETARLKKEIEKTDKELKPFEAKMANEGFVKKAPPEVLEKTRGIIAELTQKKEKLGESYRRLEELR